MKRGWKAAVGLLAAVVLLAGEMNVHAATADVGQVSSYEEEDIFQLENYVTTYTGKVPRNTPTKRAVRAEGYRSTEPNNRWLNARYRYDAKENIIYNRGSSGGADSFKPTKEGTYYKYDKNGNLVKSTWKSADGKAVSWTVYDVDSDGEINRETYYNQEGMYGYSDFTYKKGRIVKRNSTWYVNGGSKSSAKYKYDSDGNLTAVISKNYKTKLTYDTSGRLISVHIDGGGSAARDRQYAYDSDGYLSKITYLFEDGTAHYTEFFYETVSSTHKTKKK